MYSVGQDIAGIDDRVVVKVPVTPDGIAVAAKLKRQSALVTATSVYSSRQAVAAIGVGADFIAPYLGRMNRAGKDVRPLVNPCYSCRITVMTFEILSFLFSALAYEVDRDAGCRVSRRY